MLCMPGRRSTVNASSYVLISDERFVLRFYREIDSGITTRLAFLFRASWIQAQTLIFALLVKVNTHKILIISIITLCKLDVVLCNSWRSYVCNQKINKSRNPVGRWSAKFGNPCADNRDSQRSTEHGFCYPRNRKFFFYLENGGKKFDKKTDQLLSRFRLIRKECKQI